MALNISDTKKETFAEKSAANLEKNSFPNSFSSEPKLSPANIV